MRIAATLLALALTGQSSGLTARSAPITKNEARSLPPAQVKQRVLKQLSDILTLEEHRGRKPPRNLLTDLRFVTAPHATQVSGLCQVDMLTVGFRSRGGERSDADTPVLARGFASEHFYHFLQVPTGDFHNSIDHEMPANDAPCRQAKLWEDEFFTAPDERAAFEGYVVAHRAMEAILAGSASFPFACEKYHRDEARDCADIVREAKAAQISYIRRCEPDGTEARLSLCYEIFAGDRSLRIIASPYSSGPYVPPPLTVLKVKVDELIIMSHERID